MTEATKRTHPVRKARRPGLPAIKLTDEAREIIALHRKTKREEKAIQNAHRARSGASLRMCGVVNAKRLAAVAVVRERYKVRAAEIIARIAGDSLGTDKVASLDDLATLAVIYWQWGQETYRAAGDHIAMALLAAAEAPPTRRNGWRVPVPR